MATKMNTFDFVLNKFSLTSDPTTSTTIPLPFTRGTLIILFKELDFKKGAEIGVASGRFSESLCMSIPDLKMYCIDPWIMYEDYQERNLSQDRMDILYESTKEKLAHFNCEIIKDFSMNAVKKFSPGSLDFVYIDANHVFKYVLEDITMWADTVRPGGIVSGHDYKSLGDPLPDVGKAVDQYVKDHNIKALFVFTGRNDASWFFVNQ